MANTNLVDLNTLQQSVNQFKTFQRQIKNAIDNGFQEKLSQSPPPNLKPSWFKVIGEAVAEARGFSVDLQWVSKKERDLDASVDKQMHANDDTDSPAGLFFVTIMTPPTAPAKHVEEALQHATEQEDERNTLRAEADTVRPHSRYAVEDDTTGDDLSEQIARWLDETTPKQGWWEDYCDKIETQSPRFRCSFLQIHVSPVKRPSQLNHVRVARSFPSTLVYT
jgi:hypothetical protein